MAELRIQLTGAMAISVAGSYLAGRDLRSRQARTVLAFLVLNRERLVSTEEIGRLLWEDTYPPVWEVGVRSLLSQVRKSLRTLGDDVSRGDLESRQGAHRLWLTPEVWVDVEQAVLSLERAEEEIRRGEPGAAHASATLAAIILRRPFLPGVSSRWVEAQRVRHTRLLRRALECLAESWLAHRQPGLAIEAATEAVSIDPTAEPGYRSLMRANHETGNSAESVRWYHRLRNRLSSELGMEPSPDTEALFLAILG